MCHFALGLSKKSINILSAFQMFVIQIPMVTTKKENIALNTKYALTTFELLSRLFLLTLSYSSASGGHPLFMWWSVGWSNFQEYNSVTTLVQSESRWRPRKARSAKHLFSGSVLGVSLYVVVTSFEYLDGKLFWNVKFYCSLGVSVAHW